PVEERRVIVLVFRWREAEFFRFGFDQDNLLLKLLQKLGLLLFGIFQVLAEVVDNRQHALAKAYRQNERAQKQRCLERQVEATVPRRDKRAVASLGLASEILVSGDNGPVKLAVVPETKKVGLSRHLAKQDILCRRLHVVDP